MKGRTRMVGIPVSDHLCQNTCVNLQKSEGLLSIHALSHTSAYTKAHQSHGSIAMQNQVATAMKSKCDSNRNCDHNRDGNGGALRLSQSFIVFVYPRLLHCVILLPFAFFLPSSFFLLPSSSSAFRLQASFCSSFF